MCEIRIETMIEIIRNCEYLGNLELTHDTYINDYKGLDKIDFETEYMKKYQELSRRKDKYAIKWRWKRTNWHF